MACYPMPFQDPEIRLLKLQISWQRLHSGGICTRWEDWRAWNVPDNIFLSVGAALDPGFEGAESSASV